MKEIPLTYDMAALVDDEDYDWIAQWKWHTHKSEKNGKVYACRTAYSEQKSFIYMHRLILPPVKGLYTDHIDRNGLNNQRANLRLATPLQNSQNATKWAKPCTSQYRGVWEDKQKQRWGAAIKVNRRRIYLGYFASEIEAAVAYDAASRKHHGDFAYLNFPEINGKK